MQYWATTLGWSVDALMSAKEYEQHAEAVRRTGANPITKTPINNGYSLTLVNTFVDLQWVDNLHGKLPIVLWIHEGNSVVHKTNLTPAQIAEIFAKANLLIFDTNWQREHVFRSFLDKIPPARITSVHCGIRPLNRPDTAALASRDAGRLRVLNIGSVYPRKRQIDMARALVNLASQYPIHGDFVGDLTYIGRWSDTEADFITGPHDCLTWHGMIGDDAKEALIQVCDIGCFPSGEETFGISALEIASASRPIVLADLEVYNHVGWAHGVNCLKYRAGDIITLQRHIEALVRAPALRHRLGAAGRLLSLKYSEPTFCETITYALEHQLS